MSHRCDRDCICLACSGHPVYTRTPPRPILTPLDTTQETE